jgi:hypothetical protein
VAEANGFHSSWCICITDFAAPHPWPDAEFMTYGGGWGKRPEPQPIAGLSWLDLWRAADALIVASGDDSHTEIEVFIDYGEILELRTGS